MCQALAMKGHDVCLVYKDSPRFSENVTDPFFFYGVKNNFLLKGVRRPPFKGGGLLYSWGMNRVINQRKNETDLVFSRDISGALYAIKYGLPLIYETHVIPDSSGQLESLKKILGYAKLISVVILTEGLLKDFKKVFGQVLNDQKLIVAHDAFTIDNTPPDFRPITKKRIAIGYAGNLYAGKGLEVIGRLAKLLPQYDFNIAGGEQKDIQYWKNKFSFKNLKFLGFMPPGALTNFYQAQDILLLPPQKTSLGLSGNNIASWMSPMKLFEYMNVGRPIIASSLDVLKEVLTHNENALLADPDDIEEWAKAINLLINDDELTLNLSKKAYRSLVEKYTWNKRVEHIFNESQL